MLLDFFRSLFSHWLVRNQVLTQPLQPVEFGSSKHCTPQTEVCDTGDARPPRSVSAMKYFILLARTN